MEAADFAVRMTIHPTEITWLKAHTGTCTNVSHPSAKPGPTPAITIKSQKRPIATVIDLRSISRSRSSLAGGRNRKKGNPDNARMLKAAIDAADFRVTIQSAANSTTAPTATQRFHHARFSNSAIKYSNIYLWLNLHYLL